MGTPQHIAPPSSDQKSIYQMESKSDATPTSIYQLYHPTPEVLAEWTDPNAHRITLRTTDGQWKYTALRTGDPIFGDVIPDQQVELPSQELVVRSTVGEVISSQWSAVEELFAYLNVLYTLEEVREGQPREEGHTEPTWMTAMLVKQVPLRRRAGAPPSTITKVMSQSSPSGIAKLLQSPVYLHHINKIVGIVNLPANWELAVIVDDHTPEVQRRAHLLRMGSLMMDQQLFPLALLDHLDNIRSTPAGYLIDLLKWVTSTAVSNEGVKYHMTCLTLGHIRNSLLLTLASDYQGKGIDWQLVRWNELFEMMTEHGYCYRAVIRTDDYTAPTPEQSQQYQVNMVYNSLALMCGKLAWPLVGQWGNSLTLTIPHDVDISHVSGSRDLFQLLLRSIPDDSSPPSIGLDLIVEHDHQYRWMDYWDEMKYGPHPPAYDIQISSYTSDDGVNIGLRQFVQHYIFQALAGDTLQTDYHPFDGSCGTYAFIAPVVTLEKFRSRLPGIHHKLGTAGLQQIIQSLDHELERNDYWVYQLEMARGRKGSIPRNMQRMVDFVAAITEYLEGHPD